MGLKVYVIQQGPVHNIPSYAVQNIYKTLLQKGQLTNANLRKASLSRKDYVKQQTEVEKMFSPFKGIRGLTFINIGDLICDAEACSVGTVEQPFFADRVHMTPVGASRLKSRMQKYISY
jgi:hypothetical protein